MTDPLVGQQLDEYRLEALLGQGGMARVYRALDIQLKRYAAVKVIDTPFRNDASYARRFDIEAQAIAKLEHPHIVHLYRYGKADGLLYIALQYIEGVDLGAVLAGCRDEGAFIEPQDACRMIGQVCAALDYAHAKGVIHRDVKPSNILLDKQGDVHLTDFGLVLLTEVGTYGETFGSPYYIAPEQAVSSAGVVPQSDLYAVGVILYEMFAGQLPFEGQDPLDVVMLRLSEQPRSPRELRPDITPELEAVILKAMAQEPVDRYPTGAALADALEHALRAQAPGKTMGKTIFDRVALDMAAHPLPLIPITPPLNPPAPPPVSPPDRSSSASGLLPAAELPPAGSPLPVGGPSSAGGPLPASGIPPAASSPIVGRFSPAPGVPMTAGSPPPVVPAAQPARLAGLHPLVIGALVAGLGGMLLVGVLAGVLLGMYANKSRGTASVPSATHGAAGIPAPTTSAATAVPPLTLTPAGVAPATQPGVAPSQTPVPTTVAPVTCRLLILGEEQDSLFLVNQTESGQSLPLAPLQLGEAGQDSLKGDEWQIPALKKGDCVVAWKGNGDPEEPEITCNRVGARVTRQNKKVFWKSEFKVYYGGKLLGTCRQRCVFDIPIN